ncbi:MAG: chromosomal replication initiator DnaA [Rubrimonas sp.]|uniref:HdaA/DnaA family protein n=1 Tax=Rubrimonas sp. TaxID=2036015 RepID=UPI002FDE1F7D
MGRAEFVEGPPNAAALRLVEGWRGWPGGRLALVGPEGAGKTHLAHVFAGETGATILAAAALAETDAPALLAAGACVVEDADRLSDAPDPAAAETALFHLMNFAAAEGAALLLTGRDAPARWPCALPDLRSRLAAAPLARLDPPDDALLEAVIAKQLADRRLAFQDGLPAYLARRIERSFAAGAAVVAALDAASLAEKRAITVKLAGELLG